MDTFFDFLVSLCFDNHSLCGNERSDCLLRESLIDFCVLIYLLRILIHLKNGLFLVEKGRDRYQIWFC